MKPISFVTAILVSCIACYAKAQATVGMLVYVTPYYNSDGPQIKVGPFSKELASATPDSIVKLAEEMKGKWETLPIETMYVLSIRLYDLGHKNDAVYWFYSADFRSRLLRALVPKESLGRMGAAGFELVQAHSSFRQLAGKYINNYALSELDKFQETIRLVKTDNEKLPKFKLIYPTLDFVDAQTWPQQSEVISAGLDKLLDYITHNRDEINAKRKKNGMQDK